MVGSGVKGMSALEVQVAEPLASNGTNVGSPAEAVGSWVAACATVGTAVDCGEQADSANSAVKTNKGHGFRMFFFLPFKIGML